MPKKETKAEKEQALKTLIIGDWRLYYKDMLLSQTEGLDDPFPLLLEMIGSGEEGDLHASFALSAYGCKHLDKSINYVEALHKLTEDCEHNGIKKELLRILRDLSPIPDWETTLLDLAFGFLKSPVYSKAVHYYSLDIAYLTVLEYPELYQEYKAIVQDAVKWGSGPFQAKVRKYEVKLEKKATSDSHN